ncbi:WD40-repeat-containing domain protein [Dipodascopsis tothii]|uniref:WD40-repeat-containing domain protein n=1 Tax=Dipodascopsis tothii TaxID=44089 RepID=UPI0034CEA57B
MAPAPDHPQPVRRPSTRDVAAGRPAPPVRSLRTTAWRVPESNPTCIAADATNGIVVVGSDTRDRNLFVYELAAGRAEPLLHRQTVTLPDIVSVACAPAATLAGRVIATGHRSGRVHLVSLPETSGAARIVRRFDAAKIAPGPAEHVQFAPRTWSCCPPATVLALCGDDVVMWDAGHSAAPLLTQRIESATCVDMAGRDGVLAVGGEFGIALLDLRAQAKDLLRPRLANHCASAAVAWSPADTHVVASAHGDGRIRVWDIRASQPFAELTGHSGVVNQLQWTWRDLVSVSDDGTARVWDVSAPNWRFDPARAAERYLARAGRRELPPAANVDAHRRRRALFTIEEEADTSETAGALIARQTAAIVGVALPTRGRDFCTIAADGVLALHHLRGPKRASVAPIHARTDSGYASLSEVRCADLI